MRRFVFLAVVCVAFVACGDSLSPEESAAGRYALVSINGTPLPFLFFQLLENKLEFTAGHIQLNSDLTCTTSFTVQATTEGVVTTATETGTCTWTLNNTAIVFTYPEGDTDTASLIDGTISLADEGIVFLFQR